MITEQALADAKAHAMAEYPRESCGIVINVAGTEEYLPCRNVASVPEHDFVIPGEDYADAEDRGDIVAIMHSHPNGVARPSDVDRASCEHWAHSFGIIALGGDPLHTAGVCWVKPCGWRAPLIGREFHYDTQNCYHLIRDYYDRELGMQLPAFESGPDLWWDKQSPHYLADFNPYMDNFASAGFVEASGKLVRGDIVLMQIRADVPNHAGVLIDDAGTMLHHLYKRLSERTVYGGYYADVTRKVIRFGKGIK